METLESYRVGDTVNLIDGHPWHGRRGVVVSIDYVPVLDRNCPKIKMEDGKHCYLTRPEWGERVVPKSKKGTQVKVSKRKKDAQANKDR